MPRFTIPSKNNIFAKSIIEKELHDDDKNYQKYEK